MLDLALPEVCGQGGGWWNTQMKDKGSILAAPSENILKSDVSQSNIKLKKK